MVLLTIGTSNCWTNTLGSLLNIKEWVGFIYIFFACRKGSQFAESWQDGSAFIELLRKQDEVTSQREEIEKERKLLMKRKPGAAGGKSNRHVTSHDPDGTKSPLPPLTIEEYSEREEVLKLRVVSLKKVRIRQKRILLASPLIYKPNILSGNSSDLVC